MGDLERIEAKLDWCVEALKHLLNAEIDYPRPEDVYDMLPMIPEPEEDMSQFEHVAIRRPPQVAAPPACTHNHQVLVDGAVRCAKCGHVLNSAGVVHPTMTPAGQIRADPDPPEWATQYSPGASSKNPGGPLVPHDVR